MKILNMKNKIMFGVYMLYAIRKLKIPFVSEILALFVLGAVLTYFVSIPNVISNALVSPSTYHYLTFAFSNTTLMVQLKLVLGVVTATKAVLNLGHLSSVGRAPLS